MRIRQIAAGILLLLILTPLQAAQPLVDTAWLLANLNQLNLVVLDLQPAQMYNQHHVPGAVNSDYSKWRRTNASGSPKMIPSVATLERLIGEVGIDNQTHVVLMVTGRGAGEMASATRVYWTFKTLGHEKISILDSGLVAYATSGKNKMESKINRPEKKVYKAKPAPEYLVTAEVVKESLDKGVALIDNRSGAEHMGIIGGRGKERPDTIPGSVDLPFDWLTVNGGAKFHSIENLKRIYQATGVPLDGEQISYCHTGHRTSLAWFVSHELLGNKKARMYDGSSTEWSADHSLPMEQKIKLN